MDFWRRLDFIFIIYKFFSLIIKNFNVKLTNSCILSIFPCLMGFFLFFCLWVLCFELWRRVSMDYMYVWKYCFKFLWFFVCLFGFLFFFLYKQDKVRVIFKMMKRSYNESLALALNVHQWMNIYHTIALNICSLHREMVIIVI